MWAPWFPLFHCILKWGWKGWILNFPTSIILFPTSWYFVPCVCIIITVYQHWQRCFCSAIGLSHINIKINLKYSLLNHLPQSCSSTEADVLFQSPNICQTCFGGPEFNNDGFQVPAKEQHGDRDPSASCSSFCLKVVSTEWITRAQIGDGGGNGFILLTRKLKC